MSMSTPPGSAEPDDYIGERNHIPFSTAEERVLRQASTWMLGASMANMIGALAVLSTLISQLLMWLKPGYGHHPLLAGAAILGIVTGPTAAAVFFFRGGLALRRVVNTNEGDQAYLADSLRAVRGALIAQTVPPLLLLVALVLAVLWK